MEIETRSTSRDTAVCSPVVLREGPLVRLLFLPIIVNNPGDPAACVRGHFVYEKKRKHDEWVPITEKRLADLRVGDGIKFELTSGELLTLGNRLRELYRLHRITGVQPGRSTFVKVENSLARFFSLGDNDFRSFLEGHPEDAVSTLLRLVQWLAASPQAATVAGRLTAISPEDVPDAAALLGLANVKAALKVWQENRNNDEEEFWQEEFAKRSYVLSQVFAYPVVVVKGKAYVGGKVITNQGGKVVDFLLRISSTNAPLLIEIKTPETPLLGGEYRTGVHPLHPQLAGAIAQVLSYRHSLVREYNSIFSDEPKRLACEPRCLVVAGNTAQLTSRAMCESFELQRDRLQGVTVVTYDELYGRLAELVQLLEGG